MTRPPRITMQPLGFVDPDEEVVPLIPKTAERMPRLLTPPTGTKPPFADARASELAIEVRTPDGTTSSVAVAPCDDAVPEKVVVKPRRMTRDTDEDDGPETSS